MGNRGDFSLIKVKRDGERTIPVDPKECQRKGGGLCVSSSGDSLCGCYFGFWEIEDRGGKKIYAVCQNE